MRMVQLAYHGFRYYIGLSVITRPVAMGLFLFRLERIDLKGEDYRQWSSFGAVEVCEMMGFCGLPHSMGVGI